MKKIIRFILGSYNLFEKIYNIIIIRYQKVNCGSNFQVNGKIYCVSNSNDGIRVGNNVKINSCYRANPIGGDSKTTLFAKGSGKIIIGDSVGISNATIFSTLLIKIENNVLIGGNTKIYDSDFHWLDYENRKSLPGGASAPIKIKEGAFIGAHCIILKGVTIGKYAVIGAGSVVTKDIPDYEIWAGNPIKFIKKLV